MLSLALQRLRKQCVVALLVPVLGLSGCGGRPIGVMTPTGVSLPGTSSVDMLVATTRAPSEDPAILFSGERGTGLRLDAVKVSIPPKGNREIGQVQWPQKLPGDPLKDFTTVSVDTIDKAQGGRSWLKQHLPRNRRMMIFVHGFNNRYEEAVYRFAQIVHDSRAPVVPVLFTWPSRGSILAYGYDLQSNNYSRDALEQLLTALATNPNVSEVDVLAHSMGNVVTLEALRQMAIRNGRVYPKIRNVMLAAPDVDVDVFCSQMADIGPKGPKITLFVSQDDRALAASRRVWGNVDRLGRINPEAEPFASELAKDGITVIDLTKLRSDDPLNHGKFASSPEVVQAIGARLASGQTINDSHVGLGDKIVAASAGAAATVGAAAGVVVAAPIAVVDPNTRRNFQDNVEALGDSIEDSAKATTDVVTGAAKVGQ